MSALRQCSQGWENGDRPHSNRWMYGLAWLLLAAFFLCAPPARALTNGDVALVFFTADGNDAVAFVALTNIPANTGIYFSDLGWTNSNRKYSTSEGKVLWSHTSEVTPGTVVVITNLASGTITATIGSGVREGAFNLGGTDSLLVSYSNATEGIWHLFGSKWTTDWGSGTGTAMSEKPTELSGSAMYFSSSDNFRFNRTLTNGTKAELLAAITNTANWTVAGSGSALTNLPFTVNNPSSSSPDVAVLGTNLSVIVISNTAPAFANGTDFGGVGVNQSNVVRTFTITNSGTASLGIGNVSTSGTHASDFVVISQPAASLAANATTTFQVRFDPSASGTRTATLTFTNNVSGKSPYPFAVQGTGVLAGVLSSPASITVTTMVGTALGTQTFGVTNVGRGRLDYSITTNASWLSVSPVTAQLAESAGQQETITFNVTGLYAGTSNANVTVDGGSTASNTATVSVSLVLTNIPNPSAASATVDGKELVRLAWTKHSAFNVLIVYQQGSAPGAPANGTAYSVGNAIPGGGTVIYAGSGAALEHVVRTNAAHYYEFYSINNNHYSPGLSASETTTAYGDGEIVDQVAYTNGVNLSGLGGGVGWTNNWSDDNPGAYTIAQYSLPAQTNYPVTNANKIVVTPPSDQGRQAYRYFNGYTGGKVYAGYKLNIQYNGPNKYSGVSFMQGSTEKMFFGEVYGSDQKLGIGGTVSGSNLYAGVGNDYIVIARYDFDTDVGSVLAYKIGTDAVPASEPGTWHATTTDSSITRIDGLRLASGAGAGSGTPGNTYFDEIRVATNWTELLRLVAQPDIAVLGTNFVALATGNTPAGGNGSDFGQTPVTGGQVDRTFYITNSGAANLSVSGVTTSGAQAAEFSVIAPASYPMTVSPGTASNLVIRFDPGASGTRTAAVTVASNDADEPTVIFHVSGTGSVAATVTTSPGTATNTTTATVGGNVTADGLAPVTNRGVVYKTSAGVTISDNKTQSGSGTGAFTANLSSLSVNTRYYFKAYAQNAAGDALGSELEFWTWANVPSAPTVGSATASSLNVTVNENGNPASTVFSIQVTNSAQYVQTNGTLGATEHWQTDAAWGTKTVTGLSPGQQYGFQVRARNGQGTLTAWSAVGNGTTLANPPTVSTTIASATNQTTATAGGNVTADGGATVTNRGVVWALSPATPSVPGAQTTNGTGTGSFSSTLTNLTPGATYNYRAFAQNSAGTSYGTQYSLTTPCFSGVVTGLTASVTNETDFTASWSNVVGASGYALDVSTNAAFGGSGGGNLLSNSGFETGDSTGWDKFEANYSVVTTDPQEGTYHVACTATATRDLMQEVSITGDGTTEYEISFYYKKPSGSGNARIWSTWTAGGQDSGDDLQPATYLPVASDWTKVTYLVVPSSGANTLEFEVRTYSGATVYWDSFFVGVSGGGAPSYLPGYSNRTVAGTSQSVTGLTGGVTYYFRARATNDYCITANSATSSVTTVLIIPDITVRGNNSIIADGDTGPSPADHTDFGSVGLINSNLVRTYTITNSGLATLTLQNVAVTGDFTVISQPSLSVAPGGSTTFQIRFDPSGAGVRSATVWITNNVTGKNPYDFLIQGTGVQAGIVRSPTSISLTTMVGSSPSAQGFGVTNGGLGQLIYTITTNVNWLSVSPVGATLAESAGQQHTVSFNVNGLVAGTSNATITITDGNASNSPQTVTVALTLTNIPNPTAVTGWADGRELVRLGWTRPAGLDVMIVHRSTNAPTAPTQGQAYTVGDVIGGNGSRVIYKGSAAQLEHVIIPGQTNHYAFYAINNNHYAPGVATNLATTAYPAGEIVEVFAYTNGGTLATSGHGGGGNGWTNSWQGDTSSFNVSSGNFANISSYPTGAANRIRINSGDLDNSSKSSTRQFPAITTGKVYAAYVVNFAYGGGSKYAGMSFMDNSTEELFFGEGFAGDQKLTVGSTTSASNLYAGIGNDYVVIGMYDFDADTGYVASYKIGTDTVPASEPATWHATVSDGSVTRINGIRLAAGGTGGGVTPGDTYFDEVRVATSWELLLANYDLPEIDVLGTNRVALTTANTPDFGNGSDFGVTAVTGGQVDRTLFITNSGAVMLNVTGVITSGTQAAEFIVVSWPTKVSPGAVSNLVLRFDPNASGVRTAAVTVANDDADESSYVFHVRGTGQVPPTVTTTIASATNLTTATAGGNVTADGFAMVTNRGVVWALTATPTVPGAQTTNGTGTGAFSSTLTNLVPGATYYYRAFAQNIAGTAYGTEYTLTTPCFSGVVTGLFASATNVLDFTATWSNYAGASGYALDVSTNGAFASTSGNYGSEAFTNVGGGTTSSYLTRQWTNNGVAWTGLQARTDQTINGTEALTLQNANGSWLASQSITGGIDILTFKHQRKFGTSGDTGGVDVFVNATKVATNVPYSDNVVTTVVSGISVSGSFVISITNATIAHRVAVDDVTWSNSVASATFVPGYSNRAVSGTSQSVTGLASGVDYYFRVRATNAYCTTLNSSTASVTTISLLPTMPTGLTASDGTSPLHVALSWNDVGTEDGYLIWRSLTSATNSAAILATNAANVTTYNDTSASPGQIYWYWVSATNLSGSSALSASNDGYRALSAPSPVLASDGTSTNHVEVTWPGVTGADGYSIWRHTANDSNAASYVGATTPSTSILSEDFESAWVNNPAGWTNQILSGTTNWIRASGGVSANPSAAHGGTYNARLSMSTSSQDYTNRLITPSLNLSGYTNTAVNFWHAQAFYSPDQDLLRVYYRTSSVSSWVQLAEYTANVTAWTERNLALPNPSADYYLAFEGVATYGYGVCLDDVAVTGAPLSTLSYLDTSAVPGQQYYYWVRATNIASSSQSGWGTPDTGYRKLATVPNVTASYDTYTTKVEVQWTDITGETGYGIWRHTTDNTNAAAYVGSVGAGVTNYADTSASVGVEYYYWVRGTNTTSSSQGDLQPNGALGRRADPNLPVVTTDDITDITPGSAKGGGNVTFGGGSAVTERGVVWSTNSNPTTANSKQAADAGGTGTFTNFLSSLIAGQTYYVRAYASNSFALVYGSNKSFTAACFTNTVTGLYANPTNYFDFTANWPALPGASGYRLDVSTNATFGSAGTFRAQGFEAAPADTWGFVTAGSVTTSTTRKRAGTYSLRLDGATTALVTFDAVALSGISASTVTVAFSASGPDTDEDLFLSVCTYEGGVLSSNTIKLVDGNSNADIAFNTTNVTTVSTNPYAVSVSAAATQVYVVVYAAGLEAGDYYYLDDVSLTGFQEDRVSGYDRRAVAGASAAVTGLTQNTTYYYRVRPVGAGSCAGDLSSTGSVVTLAAPVIGLSTNALDFGTVPVSVASNLTLAVTNSGSANLIISSLALSGGCSGSYAVNPSALTVLPGTASNVVVTFTPSVTGACSVTLTVNNNTPGTTAPTVSLTGTGYDPSSIQAPTSVTAVADGAEMVVMGWTKVGGTPNVIVLSSSNAITATALTAGLPYAMGDNGPGGTKVAYHGSANSGIDLVVSQRSTNYYRLFGGVGTLYSTNYADPAVQPAETLKYETGEIIDQFAYTNNATLAQNNLATGQGWSGGWTGDTNKYQVIDTNLLHGATGFPDPRANKLFWQDTSTFSADDAQVTRLLSTARGGRVFVAFMMNYQYDGTEKYVGLSLMSGAAADTEEIFFGKLYGSIKAAGIEDPGAPQTTTASYDLEPGHGNDYMIVGELYPAQKTVRMWAFYQGGGAIPQDYTNATPVAVYSNSSLTVSTITGIRLSAGSSGTANKELGHVYFDEVRVGGTWDEVLNFNYPKVYDYQVGTRINGTNYVYDGDLVETGKTLAVSYTLYHRSGITNAQFTILDEGTGLGLYPTNVPLQFGANLAAGRQRYTNSVTNRLSVGSVDLGTYTSRVFMTASSGRATNSIVVAETGGASDLFFGEFGEGNDWDKYVEIYNGTGGAIDLSQYLLASQTTPGDKYVKWANWSQLSAATYWLDHGQTLVLLNGGLNGGVAGSETVNAAMTNAMITAGRPYLFTSNNVLQVSGDDPVALFRVSDTNAWVDVCGIGPSVARYIMRRVEDADVPRSYPLQVATNQWDYRDWESDRATGYTNFIATAGVYDRNVGLGGYITFDVIDDDTNVPVASAMTVLVGGSPVSESLTAPLLLAGWNFNDPLNRLVVNHGSGTMTDNLASTNDNTGATINLVAGDVAGQDLTIQGGGNAGRYIQYSISMLQHQDLVVTFAAQRSATGYDSNTIAYAINNGSFVAVETNWNPTTSTTLKTVDLSAVSALDNATNVTFRITLGGGSGGNNRFDNFQFQAQRLVYAFTDGRLTTVNGGNPLHIGFRAYDTASGIQRGTASNGSNMHMSVAGFTTNNTAQYEASLSSGVTTGSVSTSVWAYTSFSYAQIGALYGNGTNYVPVTVTMADADNDRANDTLWRSNHVFGTLYVTDDDSEAPVSVNVNLPGAAAAPFVAATNGTAPSDAIRGFISRRSGSGTNIVTALTDEEMALAGTRQLQFVFGARDTHGQVARGSSGTTNTVQSISLGTLLSGVFTQYNAGLSSAQSSTNITTTNYWTFSDGFFGGDLVNALVQTGQVPVTLTVPDTDDDRPNDRATLYAQQVGYLRVVDDDIRGPIISSVEVDDAYGTNVVFFSSFEVGEGWPSSLSSAAIWTNVAANGTWVGNGVTHGSLDPKVSGIRRIGLLTNNIPEPWIQLPPLTDPGSLTLFAGRFSGNDVTIRVERADGGSWVSLGDRVVTNLEPEFGSQSWDINMTGVVTLRVAHAGTGPQVYVDDLSVLPQATWISTNELRIAWGVAVDDYSGVNEHRVVAPAVGATEPTATNAGVHRASSVTNDTFSIVGQQGVITGYVFAMDGDADRTSDRAMGNLQKVVVRVDTNPPPVATGLRATDASGGNIFGGIDESSEILVQWTPGGTNEAQAAGRRHSDHVELSPWDTFVITYTEVADTNGAPVANATTTTLTKASSGWSTVLDNYAFTNLVLSNLVFDTYYRITIRGRDVAGNIGLSTSVIGNTDRFVVTQGVARTQTQLQLRWSGPTNETTYRDYDVIYTDSADGFQNALTSQWQLLQYTNRPVLTDAGGPGRVAPGSLTGTTYRFYRVARQGRWTTNQASRLASEEVYVAKAIKVNPGENWYAPFFVPDTSTVAYVFGTNILYGGSTFDEATRITWFQSSTGGTTNQNGITNRTVWLASSGNWYFWPNTTSNANLYNFPVNQGFLIESPTNQASRTLILVGRLPTNEVVYSIPGAPAGQQVYHILSQTLPERLTMATFGAQLYGFQGGTRLDQSDEIRILDNTVTNGVGSGSLVKPKARIWRSTLAAHASAPWRYSGQGTPSAMDHVIEPDDAVIVVRRGTAPLVWTNRPVMYTPPNKNISP